MRPRRAGLRRLLLGTAATLVACGAAQALPQGPVIAGSDSGPGGASVSTAGNVLTINQTTGRVVIDWTSFNIANGETVAFNQASPNWIAFNRVMADPATGVSPTSTLSGSLTATGGVWLFSPGGIVVGQTAQVDVGSFALITGPLAGDDINQLLFADPNGLTTVGIGAPNGSGVEQIMVQPGAVINAANGYVVLQAESILQGGDITAADGVAYAVGESGQVQFLTSDDGQQLQSAGVIPVAGQDRPDFSHSGSTTALWVGIDTPGGALQADYTTVVGIGGSILASGVKPDGGDNGVVFLVGGAQGPDYPGYTNSSIGVDTSTAIIAADHGMQVSTDNLVLGETTLGGSLDVSTYGDITVAAPVVSGGSINLNSVAGALALNAGVTASGSVYASDASIAVDDGVTLRSDSGGEANGAITLLSTGDITAAPTSLLVAGSGPQGDTDDITLVAGIGAGGGSVSVGAISGRSVFIQSLSQGQGGQGAITLDGDVHGGAGVSIFIDDINSQGGDTGDFKVFGNLTSAGFIDLENLGHGDMLFGPGVAVTSTGNQVFLSGGGDTIFAAGVQVTGLSILERTLGALTVSQGASLTTTGAPQPLNGAVLPYGAEFRRASGLNLAAGTMHIEGQVTAGAAAARDDVLIEVLNTTTPASLGGAGDGAGFNLSNASFSHLSGRNVVIMNGPGETTAPGVDLQVGDLTLDSARISGLWLGAASSRKIVITGALTPSGQGPIDLRVGFVREGLGGNGVGAGGAATTNPDPGTIDGFIPGEIDIEGGLGSASAPVGLVSLIARNDIFMGAPAFIDAASADPGFDAVTRSAGYPGLETGHLFVAAQTLSLSAQGRIIQQATSPAPYAGLLIGAPTQTSPLIAVPAGIDGRTIGAAGWTAAYSGGPTRIDLFGTVRGATADVGGFEAAGLDNLTDRTIVSTKAYRINSCIFGGGCAPATVSLRFEVPILIDETTPGTLTPQFTVTATPVLDQLSTYAAIGNDVDSERLGSTNPVTESGARELWTSERKRRRP